MAKISQGENGLLIDGEPLDPNGIQELSDEELEATSGGVKIYTKQENHWWGDKYIYLVCGACGGATAGPLQANYDINKLYVMQQLRRSRSLRSRRRSPAFCFPAGLTRCFEVAQPNQPLHTTLQGGIMVQMRDHEGHGLLCRR